MDPKIENLIDQYIEKAKAAGVRQISTNPQPARPDNLSRVIRTKKDAEDFMAELNMVIARAK